MSLHWFFCLGRHAAETVHARAALHIHASLPAPAIGCLLARRNYPDHSLSNIAKLGKLQKLELSGVGFTETKSQPEVGLQPRSCLLLWTICSASLLSRCRQRFSLCSSGHVGMNPCIPSAAATTIRPRTRNQLDGVSLHDLMFRDHDTVAVRMQDPMLEKHWAVGPPCLGPLSSLDPLASVLTELLVEGRCKRRTHVH